MSTHAFKPAELKNVRLRLLVTGPSGSGKTYTALKIAAGLAGHDGVIGLIDSERGSSELYADRFPFLVDHLRDERSIEEYVAALRAAAEAGIDVLVIDSLTHAWHYLLDKIDQLAIQKYRGNSFSAWARGRPYQRKFVDAFLQFPGHLICTARVKTAWELVDNDRGKKEPQKLGLKPDQDGDLEYEFHVHLGMDMGHMGTVHADKTGQIVPALGEVIEHPGEELGQVLLRFLQNGKADHEDPLAFREMLTQRFPDAGGDDEAPESDANVAYREEPTPRPTSQPAQARLAQAQQAAPAPEAERKAEPATDTFGRWQDRSKMRFLTGMRDAGVTREMFAQEFGVDDVDALALDELSGERLRAIFAFGVAQKALRLHETKQALGVERVIDAVGLEPKDGFAKIEDWIAQQQS